MPQLSWVVRLTCSCWPGGPNVKCHSGSWAWKLPPKLVVLWEVIEPLGGRVLSGEVHQWKRVLRFYSLVPLPLSFSVSCLVKCDQFLTATPAPAAMPSQSGCTVCQNCSSIHLVTAKLTLVRLFSHSNRKVSDLMVCHDLIMFTDFVLTRINAYLCQT